MDTEAITRATTDLALALPWIEEIETDYLPLFLLPEGEWRLSVTIDLETLEVFATDLLTDTERIDRSYGAIEDVAGMTPDEIARDLLTHAARALVAAADDALGIN
jgi:hypothetical protein